MRQHFATQLYQAGASLALCDLDLDGLKNTLQITGDDGDRVKLFQLDGSDQSPMQEFGREVESQIDPADILINNAGICLFPQTIVETPDEQFAKVIDLNMWGPTTGSGLFYLN